ncbi:MAG: FMN-binding protein [Treponema sp.]|nr:FMN-binding protein [Treponema sp.]
MKTKMMVILLAPVLLAACVNLKDIVITSPDLSVIPDGTYRGDSKVGPVRVTLDVTVQDRTITGIEIIRHFNGLGKKAEAIVPAIIAAQSLEVDVVSGATGSSKAILKAVENSLSGK